MIKIHIILYTFFDKISSSGVNFSRKSIFCAIFARFYKNKQAVISTAEKITACYPEASQLPFMRMNRFIDGYLDITLESSSLKATGSSIVMPSISIA